MTSVREIAQDALGSARKRRQISRNLKRHGLKPLGKGSWLAFRGADVASGFIIEGSPLDTYITAFVLPSFDRRTFVGWSLGCRVVHCSLSRDTEEECEEALLFYKAKLNAIETSEDLLKYIYENDIKGHYAIWVHYLCLLRGGHLAEAESWLDADKLANMHQVQLEEFDEINRYVVARDVQGVARTLNGWERVSEQIFGPFQQEFRAF